jgi:hypothetical protein
MSSAIVWHGDLSASRDLGVSWSTQSRRCPQKVQPSDWSVSRIFKERTSMTGTSPSLCLARASRWNQGRFEAAPVLELAFERLSSLVLVRRFCPRDRLSTAISCYWDACRRKLCRRGWFAVRASASSICKTWKLCVSNV